MPDSLLSIASFLVAILTGALVKATYYLIPVVAAKWKLWRSGADASSAETPDFWLSVLLSLPISGVAAIAVIQGMDSKYDLVPLAWPVLSLIPNYLSGPQKMLHHLKNWKLNLLEGTGVALSATSALIATRVILGFH